VSDRRVNAAALQAYVAEIMRAHGVDEDQVRSVSDNLIWSELVGRSNFGVIRLPIHLKRVRLGVLRSPCRPTFEPLSPAAEVLDGDNGFGHHVAALAMQRAVELARQSGIGVVGVRNSNFFGTGAYFVHQAAQAGMIGIAMSNSFPKVVAHGGVKPVLGTNPFAFGSPRRNGETLMLDMATSALAGSTVREHISNGSPLPVGLAIDSNGEPITDARKIEDGALLPFGGAKGYGLSLMVEILAGVITGAGISDGVASLYKNFAEGGHSGHFLLALDVSRFMPMEQYFDRFDRLAAIVEGSGPNDVLLPGQIRWRNYEENLARGIPIPDAVSDQLVELSRPFGLEPPWGGTTMRDRAVA
jgi:LDH2 family malate/lactate/ureidoglycolate dehydrogenase